MTCLERRRVRQAWLRKRTWINDRSPSKAGREESYLIKNKDGGGSTLGSVEGSFVRSEDDGLGRKGKGLIPHWGAQRTKTYQVHKRRGQKY